MAIFWFNKYISISSGLGSALWKFTKFPVFLALKYTSMIGLTDIAKLKKKKKGTNLFH